MSSLHSGSGEMLRAAFDAVLQTTTDGVVLVDTTTTVIAANRGAVRILGARPDEVMGAALERLLPETGPLSWSEVLSRASSGEVVRLGDVRLHRQDDLPIALTLFVTALAARSGVDGFCVVLHDDTEQALAQETLQLSEQRVQRMESLTRTGSFVMDATADSVQWSIGMYELLGAEPSTFTYTREAHFAFVHPADVVRVESMFAETATTGATLSMDHRAVAADGSALWLNTAVEPVIDGAGAVVGVRGACQDVTARKESEERLRTALRIERAAAEELRRADAVKDEFLATVSHELRTPLTAIIGFSTLLRRRLPEHAAQLDPVLRNAREMRRMIEKLLDYTRLQAGQFPFQPQPVELRRAVAACVTQFAELATRQELVNDVSDEVIVLADADGLDRILANLVGNALRYAGDDAVIRISADRVGDTVLIDVSDTGPGIDPEVQTHLFERFYRAPGATRGGTGIGLTIVRQYAEYHGGSVVCHSAVGEGTTFRVTLPQPREPLD